MVPASYFIEGTGPKGQRVYHRIEPTDQAFALGGLYRTWLNRETGEVLYSCSVITLPPHVSDTWQAIHPKSTPFQIKQWERREQSRQLHEEAEELAQGGEIDTAIQLIEKAEKLVPETRTDAMTLNEICWFSALSGRADAVLDYCEKPSPPSPSTEAIAIAMASREH